MMQLSHQAKLILHCIASILAILILLCFLERLETTHSELPTPKAQLFRTEEPLVLSALNCCYPDEDFKQTQSEDFAKAANVSSTTDYSKDAYWSIEYHPDYRAIFVNLGLYGDNSIDIYDGMTTKKEDAIANNPSSAKQCISIWLVSPFGRYDMIWHDPDMILDSKELREGFAIHLNPKPET